MADDCILSTPFMKQDVHAKVQELWKEQRHQNAPLGAMRHIWKTKHCPLINPYGSEGCPYAPEDCALAFLGAAQRAVHGNDPIGYFHSLARSYGIDRADRKPLARDRIRTDGPQRPGHPGGSRVRPGPRLGDADGVPHEVGVHPEAGRRPAQASPDMHRPTHRPEAIGDLLGALDLRPHQRPTTDGKESPK